jgi:hypothetical protein
MVLLLLLLMLERRRPLLRVGRLPGSIGGVGFQRDVRREDE